MSTNQVVGHLPIEEVSLDRDRIVDGHLVPNEYFCPICQYLLWKPRSCSSCQNLFCEKCIRTWLESTNSENKCPFRCEPFLGRQCPPFVQSSLSRLNIHCRNSEFGCTQILSYDFLEHHENVECKYLTKQCSECEKLVLVSKFDEHRQMPGLCIPCPIKCTICQNYIEKSLLHEHFYRCCQERINELNRMSIQRQNFNAILNRQPVVPNHGLTFLETITNTIQLVEQQRQMARLPTSLKGVESVTRAREQNCGHFYHILIMFKFMLLNWSKIPYFIFAFSSGGFGAVGLLLIGGYTIFCHWAFKNLHCGFIIILLSFVLSYGTWMLFQLVFDRTMILFFGIFIFLWGCTSRMSLEILEMNPLFNRPITSVALCCVGIFLMKLILLLIHFYYWLMSLFVGASVVTLINFYLGWKVHCAYAKGIAATTNQLVLPV